MCLEGYKIQPEVADYWSSKKVPLMNSDGLYIPTDHMQSYINIGIKSNSLKHNVALCFTQTLTWFRRCFPSYHDHQYKQNLHHKQERPFPRSRHFELYATPVINILEPYGIQDNFFLWEIYPEKKKQCLCFEITSVLKSKRSFTMFWVALVRFWFFAATFGTRFVINRVEIFTILRYVSQCVLWRGGLVIPANVSETTQC